MATVDAGGEGVAVLGTTTIDGQALTRRQATIVAALALHRPEAAPVDVLIDAVWPDGVPASGRQSVQNQVARLRARFGAAVIETAAGGYRLGPATDAEGFVRLVGAALAGPASAQLVGPLEKGLALWRGEPYADVPDSHAVDVERARLAELRAQAAEHLALSRLAAGDLRRAIAELAALTEDDPYRERRWELLLVALHAAGRRTDALGALARARAILARDLGAAPSPSLVALGAAVERGEPIDLAAITGAARCRWEPRRLRHRGRCLPVRR